MKNTHVFTFMHEWLGEALVSERIPIQDLCDNSLDVQVGDVFIDVARDSTVSEEHVLQAIERGAVAIVSEHRNLQSAVPVVVIPCLREHIAELSAAFYDHPSRKMQLVAITGTNGKTSTALMMMMASQSMGVPCAYIGTLGYGTDMQQFQAVGLTTPSALRLQKILHHMYCSGVHVVVIEVSSHALVQKRAIACSFDVAIFTNLSRDHLDYHHSMFDYAQAKKRLFTEHKVFSSIINVDDAVGKHFASEMDSQMIALTFHNVATTQPTAALQLDYCDKRGLAFTMDCPWGSAQLLSPLMGMFNAYNLASAWLGLLALGHDLQEAAKALSMVSCIPGRFEMYRPSPLKPMVVIDYAHTPSALEVVLATLRSLTTHHVWVVFGCGGNRDQGKRSLMGQVAERLADRVVLTSDNSRDEDPHIIIADILKGMICPWAVEIETDRAIAIHKAISEAKAGDVVLVAGKGHESTQITKKMHLSFSDKAHVLNALGIQDPIQEPV